MNEPKLRRIDDGARLPVNGYLRAHILNERGMPSKALLPPRNTRPIGTGLEVNPASEDWLCLMIAPRILALHSVFVVNTILASGHAGEVEVLLHNGGFETQYISHGDMIAKIVPLSGEDA